MSGSLLVFALTALPRAAGAQEPPPEAREFYERGQALYAEGRYREAIVELERAYMLDPAGTILVYNIGLIYEKLGEIDQAMAYYRRYLQHEIPADERARVEAVLRRLEGARPQVEEPGDPPPPTPAPRTAPRRREYGRADTLFWITGGAAVALGAGGTVAGVLAIGHDSDAEAIVSSDADDLARRRDLADKADGEALLADIALAAAISLGTACALLYFLREKDAPVAAAVAPTEGGAILALRLVAP